MRMLLNFMFSNNCVSENIGAQNYVIYFKLFVIFVNKSPVSASYGCESDKKMLPVILFRRHVALGGNVRDLLAYR